MKVAIVFDDLIQYGGAEKLLLCLFDIWPNATLYTCMMSDSWEYDLKKKNIKIHTSFMQKLPFKSSIHKILGITPLYQLAYQGFDLSGFDVVISMSARFAHLVGTTTRTVHICYMNSPGRMFWEPFNYFGFGLIGRILKKVSSYTLAFARIYDYISAQSVDYFIANAKTPQKRIKKYYKRDSIVIHPFVDIENVGLVSVDSSLDYFVIISRLVSWKKIDIAIKACIKENKKLKIVGSGPDSARLKSIAKNNKNIEFLGYLSSNEKNDVLKNCTALIQTQYEDFGLTPLEAMSFGKPVIAYAKGGALETVIDGKTGAFFNEQTVESLSNALRKFDSASYNVKDCINQASKFSKDKFISGITEYVSRVYLGQNS